MTNRRVVVTGVGLVSPSSGTARELHTVACGGSPPGERRPELTVPGSTPPLAAPHSLFDARAELGRHNLRPLDRTGRLAAAAARRALEDSGWSQDDLAASDVGLVLGTMFGSVGTIAGFDRRGVSAGPSYAKPLDFANSVINAAAGQTAIRFNLRGVNATISGDLTSGLQALGYATDLVRNGRVDAVLAGGADELCLETAWGFRKLGLLCDDSIERAIPLARRATGMVPAEAAALLMLESLDSAEQRGATILAEILGHGSGFDPAQGGEPEGRATSLADATQRAMADAELQAEALSCISLGANGTAHDPSEVAALERVLRPRMPLPAIAGKASTGEALGAAGPLQTILGIESLRRSHLPGIPGLELATGGLSLNAKAECSQVSGSTVLMTSLGLQGKSAALIAQVAL